MPRRCIRFSRRAPCAGFDLVLDFCGNHDYTRLVALMWEYLVLTAILADAIQTRSCHAARHAKCG